MAKLTGIDIYKQLPKTNCGDCNLPTCMAFAMQVAAKKTSLNECPHVSEEAQSALGDAQAPPMRTVKIGSGENETVIGGETVLFRHEEKFHHPTGIAIRVTDSLSSEQLNERVTQINQLGFTRVGEEIAVDMIAVEHKDTDTASYAKTVKSVGEQTDLPLILLCPDPGVLRPVLESVANESPLVWAAGNDNWEEMASLAAEYKVPLAVRAESFEELVKLTEQIKAKGVEDLVLDPAGTNILDGVTKLTLLRRLALEKTFRPLGYPTIVFTDGESIDAETVSATAYICRYGGIIIMDTVENWQILPLLTVRQNIYTDPQVPNAIEARVYEIGDPQPDAPVLLTTNFALTYYSVAGEVENSKVSAYISVVDTEGLGVLNAYADDKLTAERIIKSVNEQGAMDKTDHNKLIIPGLVAVLRMEIQEDSGWEVIVGPEDAAGIPHYLSVEWSSN